MAIIRTKDEPDFSIVKSHLQPYGGNGVGTDEWNPNRDTRIFEPAWVERYNHEANIISNICTNNNFTKVLELGSGPGKLADTVNNIHPIELDYTLIDKPYAKEQFKKYNHKASKFITMDLNNNFNTTKLKGSYDLFVANDFLEHIANVTDCLVQAWNIGSENSRFLISVPNWRMGHVFQYRGLFDYDNWVYIMKIHGWEVENVYKSNLQCAYSPKLSSEESMPDELIQSWNWYFEGKKINI
tara:strand:- start:75 stop:797 length:723 start_codon:yes stop_codon:yes gene_type:complete